MAPRSQPNNCAARLTPDAVKIASDEANEDAELALDEVRMEACLDPNKVDKDGSSSCARVIEPHSVVISEHGTHKWTVYLDALKRVLILSDSCLSALKSL